MKLGRCIKELERIYGVREGSAGKSEPKLSDGNIFNQSDIAEMIGISVDTLNNYKKLTELIPELEDLVDTGILAPTTVYPFVKEVINLLWVYSKYYVQIFPYGIQFMLKF